VKILLWQTAYLGDVILTTPLIRTLLENFPGARIGFVGRPFIKELLKGYPVELIPFDKSLGENLRIIGKIRDYEIVISPHRSMRTALTLFLARIRERIGFDRAELSFLYTVRVPHRWDLHEIDRNLSLLGPLGVKKFVRYPALLLSPEEYGQTLRKFSLREGEYVVLSPFSNFPLKEWSTENWSRLIELLGREFRVVVTGTKKDLKKASRLKGDFVNLVGKTSLRELMGVLRGARLVIACDSSPVHMANALGVPAITVYTATSPRYGFYPVRGSYLENPLPCSPCSPNPRRCREGHGRCRNLPPPEEVLRSAEEFLKV